MWVVLLGSVWSIGCVHSLCVQSTFQASSMQSSIQARRVSGCNCFIFGKSPAQKKQHFQKSLRELSAELPVLVKTQGLYVNGNWRLTPLSFEKPSPGALFQAMQRGPDPEPINVGFRRFCMTLLELGRWVTLEASPNSTWGHCLSDEI